MRLEYDFIRVGSFVEPRRGHVYIDVGNQSLPGVIDTHAEVGADVFECSSSLVVAKPQLVTDWITGVDLAGPVRLVMHENPDYDCIASSLLVRRLLEARAAGKDLPDAWAQWAPVVADSARRIDRGETRIRLPVRKTQLPITPYLSTIALHDQIETEALPPKEVWRRLIERGQIVIDRAVRMAIEKGSTDLEAMDLRGMLGDLGNLESIVDEKVQAFERDARRIGLGQPERLQHDLDGVFPIDLPLSGHPSATKAAKIACIRDPECGAGFFKSAIRGTYADAVQATCIFLTVPPDLVVGTQPWIRPVISVDPDSGFDLRGLGTLLDELETDERSKRGVPRAGRPRPGFRNSDPWYDGRAFAHTIVDAPRWGTVLHPREVLRALLESAAWRSTRVAELVADMLGQLRGARDNDQHHAAYENVASALAFWSAREDLAVAPLYIECLDAVGSFATAGDRATYIDLAAKSDDVVLALLASGDPVVRVDAITVMRGKAATFAEHGARCDRRDVQPLLTIAAGDASEAIAHLLVRGAVSDDHALRLAAVAARLRGGAAETPVIEAAAALASRIVGAPGTWQSIIHLGRAVHDAGANGAQFDSVVQQAEEGIAKREAQHVAPETAAPSAAAELVRWLRRSDHQALLRDRDAVMATASELLSGADAGRDDAAMQLLSEALFLLRRHFGTAALLDGLTAGATDAALRISADFIGALVRAAELNAVARWRLLASALSAVPNQTIARARRAVFRPADASVYHHLKALHEAGAAARSFDSPAVSGQCRDLALLFLASVAARGADSSTRGRDLLGSVAAAHDLLPVVDDITLLRRLIRDEVRHVTPDYLLIADAEPSLAKAEMFARAVALAGRADSTSQRAFRQLMLLGLALPEIDYGAVDELLRIRAEHRPPEDDELDGVAQRAFECAAALKEIRHGAILTDDAPRIRAAVTAVARIGRSCPADPVGRLARAALRDLETVLDGVATALDRAPLLDAEAVPEFSLVALQASTIARVASGVRSQVGGRRTLAAAHLVSRLAHAAQQPADVARAAFARARAAMREGVAEDSLEMAAKGVGVARAGGDGTAVNVLYGRIRDLLAIPAASLDAAYAGYVDALLTQYDLGQARRRIDDYGYGGVEPLLRLWMSGWSILMPLVVMTLFIVNAGQALGVGIAFVVTTAALALVFEWIRRLRGGAPEDAVESLRYKLLLPHYLFPVLIGVYTAAVTHEMAAHLALRLNFWRYALLGAGLFVSSVWALRRLIRRKATEVSIRHVLIAAGRLFAYAFVIAVALNLALATLIDHEYWLHQRSVGWIKDAFWEHPTLPPDLEPKYLQIPERVVAHDVVPRFLEGPWFPRHILLDALFGLFIGIFLRRFMRLPAEEEL